MRGRVEVDGATRLRAKLARVSAGVDRNVKVATREAAEDLLRRTRPYVPVQNGRLRRSGRVVRNADGSYSVAFGGASAPYAIYVHEMLENRHAPPTKAKFLESTYLESRDAMADEIKGAVKGGIRERK